MGEISARASILVELQGACVSAACHWPGAASGKTTRSPRRGSRVAEGAIAALAGVVCSVNVPAPRRRHLVQDCTTLVRPQHCTKHMVGGSDEKTVERRRAGAPGTHGWRLRDVQRRVLSQSVTAPTGSQNGCGASEPFSTPEPLASEACEIVSGCAPERAAGRETGWAWREAPSSRIRHGFVHAFVVCSMGTRCIWSSAGAAPSPSPLKHFAQPNRRRILAGCHSSSLSLPAG